MELGILKRREIILKKNLFDLWGLEQHHYYMVHLWFAFGLWQLVTARIVLRRMFCSTDFEQRNLRNSQFWSLKLYLWIFMCDSFLSHLLKRRIYSTQSAIKKAIQRSPILDTTNPRLFELYRSRKIRSGKSSTSRFLDECRDFWIHTVWSQLRALKEAKTQRLKNDNFEDREPTQWIIH